MAELRRPPLVEEQRLRTRLACLVRKPEFDPRASSAMDAETLFLDEDFRTKKVRQPGNLHYNGAHRAFA